MLELTCIFSRSNQTQKLLIHSSEPIKLIAEALLLDPEHPRNRGDFSQSEEVKGAIQRDAAECFMQLALFDPGRDMLHQDPSVLDALRMLVDKALTEEARQYAVSLPLFASVSVVCLPLVFVCLALCGGASP
eukprot:COSAG02_NODE_5486_length_4288_cov_1.915493_4_plen_132_part_00